MSTTVEPALWLTVPGARPRVALGWLAWLGVAVCGAPPVVATLGPAGAAIALLAVGWALARSLPAPLECLRHYHLDDTEVTAMGPGAKVRRLAWDRVETVTQRGRTLGLAGDGMRVAVPFRTVAKTTLWSAALARVVPELATDVWEGLALRGGRRGRVIPWSRVQVARVEHGISVAERDGAPTVIRAGLRNFWIALPVIELRATLAPHCPPRVTFRARCADGGLAVVGEVETVA